MKMDQFNKQKTKSVIYDSFKTYIQQNSQKLDRTRLEIEDQMYRQQRKSYSDQLSNLSKTQSIRHLPVQSTTKLQQQLSYDFSNSQAEKRTISKDPLSTLQLFTEKDDEMVKQENIEIEKTLVQQVHQMTHRKQNEFTYLTQQQSNERLSQQKQQINELQREQTSSREEKTKVLQQYSELQQNKQWKYKQKFCLEKQKQQNEVAFQQPQLQMRQLSLHTFKLTDSTQNLNKHQIKQLANDEIQRQQSVFNMQQQQIEGKMDINKIRFEGNIDDKSNKNSILYSEALFYKQIHQLNKQLQGALKKLKQQDATNQMLQHNMTKIQIYETIQHDQIVQTDEHFSVQWQQEIEQKKQQIKTIKQQISQVKQVLLQIECEFYKQKKQNQDMKEINADVKKQIEKLYIDIDENFIIQEYLYKQCLNQSNQAIIGQKVQQNISENRPSQVQCNLHQTDDQELLLILKENDSMQTNNNVSDIKHIMLQQKDKLHLLQNKLIQLTNEKRPVQMYVRNLINQAKNKTFLEEIWNQREIIKSSQQMHIQ